MAGRRKAAVAVADVPETAPAAGIGHNQPQGPLLDWTAEQWTAHLAEQFGKLIAEKEAMLASFGRFRDGFPLSRAPVAGEPPPGVEKWSDDIQGRAGDLREKLADIVKRADALHKLQKAPILTAGRAVDGYKNHFVQALDDAITEVRRRQTLFAQWQDYQSREAAKAEAEAAKKAAAAAAAEAAKSLEPSALDQAAQAYATAAEAEAHAQAKPAEHTRTFGEEGSVTSLRDNWQFHPEQSDLMALVRAVADGRAPLTYLTFNQTRIAVAIKTERVRQIPGCVISNDQVAR